MIRGVPAAEYGFHRDQVWPHLQELADISPDGLSAHDLESDIIGRSRQLWSINEFEAIALTYLTPMSVHITHAAGGKREEWELALDEEIRAWARHLGKKHVIATVRPGWSRFGKSRGYKELAREMMVEL